jgi:hypothetical protein
MSAHKPEAAVGAREQIAQRPSRPRYAKVVKIGGRIVHHGRYVVSQPAKVAVPRMLFAAIVQRIDRLRGPPVSAM